MTVPNTRQRTTTSNAKSSLWWEKSIVQRSTSSIENIVDTILMDSPFLQRHQQVETDVLQLDRSNIQIGSLLGKGSFSVVLEVKGLIAEQEEQGSPMEGRFAMKHLRPDLIQKPEMFQAAAADLLLEAKYLAALDHPGILKLRAVARGGVSAWENGQYDGYFLITDRLQGTLKDKIMEWQFLQQDESLLECLPLSGTSSEVREDHMMSNSLYSSCAILGPALHEKLLLEKLDIARQLASALQYMHERRLIFRDLKPPNVGMTADNQVRVFDFGFCRELPPQWDSERDDESQYKQLEGEDDDDDALYYMSGKGSLMYLAPEVLYNGRYNRKADCYSFAMVLYELLTLNKPFHSVSSLEVFRELLVKHKARPPLEYSDIPLPLQDLLRHSWEDTVKDRWTMKTISQRLQEISQELDPSMEQQPQEEQVPASTEPQQQLLSEPITICGGGAILDLLTGFASDVQLGYKILYGNKVLDFPDSQRQEPAPEDEDNYSDELEKQTSDLTGATEACSQFSEEPSLRINALTATEEPVEFTLEDAMSMPGWDSWSEGESEEVDDTDYDEQPLLPQLSITKTHSGAEGVIPDDEPLTPCFPNRVEAVPCDGDMRCPPSPALQRTTSAPVLDQPTICKDRAVPESPHHYPQRRMSLGVKKGFYIMPESPHYPSLSRRQSAGDINFAALPESHFLPTAAELRGILPASA